MAIPNDETNSLILGALGGHGLLRDSTRRRTAEELADTRAYSDTLLTPNNQPISHPTQAVAEILRALAGHHLRNRAYEGLSTNLAAYGPGSGPGAGSPPPTQDGPRTR